MLSAAEKQAEAWYISPDELLRRPAETGLAVDPANPAEIDDAIDVIQTEKDSYLATVHIADAGLLSGQQLLIDEARKKGWSIYGETPNLDHFVTNPMLPLSLSRDKLSLNISHYGLGSAAVSIRFRFSPKQKPGNQFSEIDIYKSRLVECESISYGEFARRHVKGEPKARMLVKLGHLLNQDIMVNYHSRNSSKETIGEYMVAANRIIANEMNRAKVPWLYRCHLTTTPMSLRDQDISNYVDAYGDLLSAIGRAQYSAVPQRHAGLNLLTPYSHYTSPLRRFADLANHLNLHNYMLGKQVPYDNNELGEISDELTEKTISMLGLCAIKAA